MDDTYRGMWRTDMNGQQIIEKRILSSVSVEMFLFLYILPAESFLSHGTAQSIYAISCYMHLVLCDSGMRGCQGEKQSMKMYLSWKTYGYSLCVVVLSICSASNVSSKCHYIVHMYICRFHRFTLYCVVANRENPVQTYLLYCVNLIEGHSPSKQESGELACL